MSSGSGGSEGDVHVVIIPKRFVAIWTLARSRSKTFFDAFFAENMAACFDCRVFKISAAYCADCKRLGNGSAKISTPNQ